MHRPVRPVHAPDLARGESLPGRRGAAPLLEGTLAEALAAEQSRAEWQVRYQARYACRSDYCRQRLEAAGKVADRMPRGISIRVTSLGVECCAFERYINGSPVLHICPWQDRATVFQADRMPLCTVTQDLLVMGEGDFNRLVRHQESDGLRGTPAPTVVPA